MARGKIDERNNWLTGFLQDKKIIEGKFNHSENIIKLSIEVDSIDNFFSKADSIAEAESWQSNMFDPNFRVYAKEMVTGGGVSEVYILKTMFFSSISSSCRAVGKPLAADGISFTCSTVVLSSRLISFGISSPI